jgi:hypothetical protein
MTTSSGADDVARIDAGCKRPDGDATSRPDVRGRTAVAGPFARDLGAHLP